MKDFMRSLILIGTSVILINCVAGKPSRWGQFHGDLPNHGFQLIDSGFALSSSWISEPYKITSASPVIGRDFQNREVIYVGTTDARLVAIRSEDGSRKWERSFDTVASAISIVASASVSDKGDIYVITNHRIGDGRARSTLHKVDQFSNPKWSYPFPEGGFTTGSPKVLTMGADTLIFVYVSVDTAGDIQGELFALRDDNKRVELLDRKPLGSCRYETVGSGPSIDDVFNSYKDVWDLVGDFPVASDESGIGLPDRFIEPTVAVVTGREKPLIAIADNLCSIGTFTWEGSELSVLWREKHNFHKHSSAVVLANGLMVFGRQDGKVLAYDVETGVKMWEYDAGQPVFATPAAPPGEFIFVVSKNHIQVIKASDGTLILDNNLPRKLDLWGETHSSPAVTANRVYVATSEMLTVTYDLKTRGHDTNFRGNGLASAAVGRDGAVYVVAADGTIRKYAGTK